jgi:hypothetical protein
MSGAPQRNKDTIPELNIDMVRAGIAAFERWDPKREPEQCMVVEVFYSMLEEASPNRKARRDA